MPSNIPIVIALRGDARYVRYLDRLLKAAQEHGVQVRGHNALAELALAEMGFRHGLMAPARTPGHGGLRTPKAGPPA